MKGQVVRRPEALRWVVMLGMALGVAVFLSVSVAAAGEAVFLSLLMALLAAASGFVAVALWRAKSSAIAFDGERLVDNAGEVLCTLDEIAAVERGFAIWKPSNGFAITLKTEKPAGWSPGLWWRYGRKIGVGGATPGRGPRNMADALTAALVERALKK